MAEDPQSPRQVVQAAGAVVFDPVDRVLLVRRGRPPSMGQWTLPGGHLEPGEGPEQAVVRELSEETAIEGKVVTPIEIVILEQEGLRFVIHEFLVSVPADSTPHPGDDAADARFVGMSELCSLGVAHRAVAVIKRGLELRRAIRYTPVNGSAG